MPQGPRRNQHYQFRVNRTLDYIAEHLDGDLSLKQLSGVAGFSAFHFHRIFQGMTGETLNSHVRRVRLERAASLMRASPAKRITDIALEAGFAGTAEFSRAFKGHFGRTASSWDRRSPLEKSKICQAAGIHTFHTIEDLQQWKAKVEGEKVRVQRFHAFRYVFRRIFEPYGSGRLVEGYQALLAWLAARGTDVGDVVFMGMSLDDPAITPPANCRYDLGVAFPQDPGGVLGEVVSLRGRTPRTGGPLPDHAECEAADFSIRDFEPLEIATFQCVGDIGHVDRAWQYLYRIWLPAGEYEPADLPAMEMFVKLPEEIGWETFNLKIAIPVARL